MANNKTKILIIEDEEVLADVLESKLKKEGYDMIMAADGRDGLNKVRELKPDMVLLDIIMPKMNGYEVLEKMEEEKIKIPVIIISNSGQPVELEKIKKMGAVDYLIKTKFNPDDVITKVKKYLNGKGKQGGGEAEIKPRESANAANKNGRKVLLVEDDSFLRDICAKKLTKEGFQVFEILDGEEALKNLEKIEPDIILLDIILPTVNGFEVLEKIRANKDKKISKTPVIMLSNLGQEEDVKKALGLGANDYLIKAHFTTEEIIEKVKKELKVK
ncbi:MAG: response regulator [Patescibacteria group bacterium]|nr:response regulator [Patescibacteria group bacterium]